MRIKIYRNKPAGKRCNTLAGNVFNAVAKIVDELDNLEINMVYVKESNKIIAPALEIDEEVLGENITIDELMGEFSTDNLVELFKEKAK